jgi:hypothetical protein
MAKVLSDVDVERLEKEIRADAAAAPQDIKDLFCKLWPDAKKLILQGVEAVGDATQKAICPQKG